MTNNGTFCNLHTVGLNPSILGSSNCFVCSPVELIPYEPIDWNSGFEEIKTPTVSDNTIYNRSWAFNEYKKMAVKEKLTYYFSLENEVEVLEYAKNHDDVTMVAPLIARMVREELDQNAKLSLFLFQEGESWITLFIKVFTNKEWKETREFEDRKWDFLNASFPSVVQKINFDFYQDVV